MHITVRTASLLGTLLATSALALADELRTGKAAYGDWQTDAPGVIRKITVNDLDAPLETPSTANRSRVVAKPAGAVLMTMPGFTVAPWALLSLCTPEYNANPANAACNP